MDTGEGHFKEIIGNGAKDQEAALKTLQEEYRNHGGTFKKGELIELRGSTFRVYEIKPNKLILKLLKK